MADIARAWSLHCVSRRAWWKSENSIFAQKRTLDGKKIFATVSYYQGDKG